MERILAALDGSEHSDKALDLASDLFAMRSLSEFLMALEARHPQLKIQVPRRISTCDSLPIMAQLVSGGFAISLLPVRMLDQELASGRVRRLEVAGRIAPHTMCLAWRASELGGGADGILPTLREVLDRTSVLQSMRSDAAEAS